MLRELCAGTAALTLYCASGRRPPLAYMGGKGSYAKQIAEALQLTRLRPTRYELYDRGEWGLTLETLFCATEGLPVLAEQARLALGCASWPERASARGACAVAQVIRAWQEDDARGLYDRLRNSPPNKNRIIRAATHLYLQTRTYRGKPVYPRVDGSGWVTYGFDPEVRGAVREGAKPRGSYNARPAFAGKIEALSSLEGITASQQDSRRVEPVSASIVYIDPDYVGTTGYQHSLSRDAVCALAEAHASLALVVAISEAEPLHALGSTWQHVRLQDHRPRRSFVAGEEGVSVGEWLTIWRAP